MKRLILLLVLFPVFCFSQGCLPEGLTYFTQAEVDNFLIENPDCAEIEGDVSLLGGINNLDAFCNIKKIGGSLNITQTELINFSGLDSLRNIGGYFDVQHNYDLESFEGLGSLENIEGPFNIYWNTVLLSMQGLHSLDSIHGYLWIEKNDGLISLVGFSDLDYISYYLKIENNPNLSACQINSICDFVSDPTNSVQVYENANGCNSKEEIENACASSDVCIPIGIDIDTQFEIDNFSLLYPYCTEIDGYIVIHGDDITNLHGLSHLTKIENGLMLHDNNTLQDLSGLENIEYLGSLHMENVNQVINFTNLESLEHIGDDVYLGENNSLISCEGLEALTHIDYRLTIIHNAALESLNGLQNIDSINNTLIIQSNEKLANIDALEYLYSVGDVKIENNSILTHLPNFDFLQTIRGDLVLQNNSLVNLHGFSNLTSIEGGLYLLSNEFINSLTDLNKLTSLGEKLYIFDYEVLTNISGLENLSSINGEIWLIDNFNLQNIYGLNKIAPSTISGLIITDNHSLSNCEAKNICDYLAMTSSSVIIHDNATGCNSQEEVETACEEASVFDHFPENKISIYPNPAKDEITILDPTNIQIKEVCIFNQTGKKLICHKGSEKTINISKLQAGLYFIEMKTKIGSVQQKLIIE